MLVKSFFILQSVLMQSGSQSLIACAGEKVVLAVGCEVDRLGKDIQRLVPGIRHVDIEAHNPNGPAPREKTSFAFRYVINP
jgi:hypothetical protein